MRTDPDYETAPILEVLAHALDRALLNLNLGERPCHAEWRKLHRALARAERERDAEAAEAAAAGETR